MHIEMLKSLHRSVEGRPWTREVAGDKPTFQTVLFEARRYLDAMTRGVTLHSFEMVLPRL
jgi:hypothetical protein